MVHLHMTGELQPGKQVRAAKHGNHTRSFDNDKTKYQMDASVEWLVL